MTISDILLIIAAVGVVLVNIITAWRTDAKVAEVKAVADGADVKLDTIHSLTNSNLTAVKADLAVALARVGKLESLIQNLVESRSPLPVGVIDPNSKTKVVISPDP